MFRRTFSCSQSKWKWVFICTILTIAAANNKIIMPQFYTTLSEDIPNGKRDPYVFASFAIVVVLLSLIILGFNVFVTEIIIVVPLGFAIGSSFLVLSRQ